MPGDTKKLHVLKKHYSFQLQVSVCVTFLLPPGIKSLRSVCPRKFLRFKTSILVSRGIQKLFKRRQQSLKKRKFLGLCLLITTLLNIFGHKFTDVALRIFCLIYFFYIFFNKFSKCNTTHILGKSSETCMERT